LKSCIDISKHYDEDEVNKFAPASVIAAWKIGTEFSENERKKNQKKLKDFVL
jgi:hypothetical protein